MTRNQTPLDGLTDGAATGQQGLVRGKPLAVAVPIEDEATRITVKDFAPPAPQAGIAVAQPMASIANGVTGRASEDVTEGRGRKTQAVETLDYVQDIMATLREPVLVLSGDLRVISANRSFYRAFQTVAEETEHQLIYELGRGQWDIPDLRLLLEAVLPENHYFDDFKVEHNFPAIGRRVMLLNARRIVRSDDRSERILLAIEDITERQRVLGTLETSELKYRRLFEAAQDGILILNADTGQITDANPFIENILGRSREELLGKRLWDVGLLADIAANQDKFRELRQAGYVRYDRLPLETETGVQTEVEFVSNVYEVGGHHVIQCNIRDISDRRRLEQQTEEQAQELANLARLKDEFLSAAAHDLRTPLTIVMAQAQLLQRHLRTRPEAGDANLEEADRLVQATERMWRMTDTILDTSRLDAGRLIGECSPTDLVALAQDVVAGLDSSHHVVRVDGAAVVATVDTDRMRQVLQNLVTNALKFSPAGGEIVVGVRRIADEVEIRVSDQGIGIPAPELKHIFERFYRGSEVGERGFGGMGIGLFLCSRIVEEHRGRIWAESRDGQGSELIVRLPAVQVAAP